MPVRTDAKQRHARCQRDGAVPAITQVAVCGERKPAKRLRTVALFQQTEKTKGRRAQAKRRYAVAPNAALGVQGEE